jgi:hypothetical protein
MNLVGDDGLFDARNGLGIGYKGTSDYHRI